MISGFLFCYLTQIMQIARDEFWVRRNLCEEVVKMAGVKLFENGQPLFGI